MIQFTSIVRNGDGSWQFTWTPTLADEYRIIHNGVEIDTTQDPTYKASIVGFDTEPPALEVVEDLELAPSEENKPFIVLQWWPVRIANHYEVQRYTGGQWRRHKIVQENPNIAVYTLKSKIHADNEICQYRVLSHDTIEQVSDELPFTALIVTPPVVSIDDTDVTYTPNTISVG